MNARPSPVWPNSWIAMMPGWLRRLVIRASRRKRFSCDGRFPLTFSDLIATERSSCRSSASYTTPIPPRPTSRTSR